MSSLLNKQIPPPASWEEFEDMCCDLWRLLWNDPNAQTNGRKGQAQAGVQAVNSRFALIPFERKKIQETVQMWRQSQAHDLTVSV